MKTTEKLAVLLLLPFFGCKGPSHLPHSAAADWFSAGYNMIYKLLRNEKVDWRKVLSLVSRRVAAYIGTHCYGAEGRGRCLVADDTDVANIGMRMEKIGQAFSPHPAQASRGCCRASPTGVIPPVGLLAARREGEGRHAGLHGQTEESPQGESP